MGKYFLPDSTDQTELSGADWLWTPVAESDRETWCEKLDKKRIERARGEGRLGHIRPLKTSRLRGNSTTAQGSGRTHTTCAMGVRGVGGWVGHLRLFKQIREEYQSPRTLREMLLVCSPAAEAFVSP